MTEDLEFFKSLLDDEDVQAFIKNLSDRADSYGEDKDKFLSFIMGTTARLFDSGELVIAALEVLKIQMALRGIGHSTYQIQDILRGREESEIKPA